MRTKKEYNEIIGITKNGEIHMVDYIFEDTLHGKPFCGATGSCFYPLTQEQVDDRKDPETLKDTYDFLWREAVAEERTEDSLEDYMEQIVRESEWSGELFPGHDNSYVDKIPEDFQREYFADAVGFECVGGGRMFSDVKAEDYEVLLRPDLLKLIQEAESKND